MILKALLPKKVTFWESWSVFYCKVWEKLNVSSKRITSRLLLVLHEDIHTVPTRSYCLVFSLTRILIYT
jgi:hypothetical protein